MDYKKLIDDLNEWNENLISELCADDVLTCDDLCNCMENCIVAQAANAITDLLEQLAKVTAEREALAANSRPAAYGEWEEIRDPYGKIEGWICKCGSESKLKTDFCPYCGADMRGKKEESQC